MSDGHSDRITLTKEEMDEECKMHRRAKEIRESISYILESDGASCQEVPTPECFPHQGNSLLFASPDRSPDSEVCVHVHPVSDATMVITVSRDIMVSSDISDEETRAITDFINETAFYDFNSEE